MRSSRTTTAASTWPLRSMTTPGGTSARCASRGTASSFDRRRSSQSREAPMTAAYRMDPTRSRFTVHAYATGLLSFMGHNPTFLVRDFGGEVVFEGGKVGGMRLALTVRAESLALADSARPADRLEIEDTTRRSVLALAAHPVIRYRADEVAAETLSPGHHRL